MFGPSSSTAFFIQQFLAKWGQSTTLNLLAEDILCHLRPMVHHPHGTSVVQALVKCRTDYQHLAMVTQWMVTNMQAVYKDKPAVHTLRCVMHLVSENTLENKESQWSKLLDQLVEKLIATVQQNRPLLIQAACHPDGHLVVVGFVRMVMKLGRDVRKRMVEMIVTYRTGLVADQFGCIVLRGVLRLL